jgi:hypothetical protein
MRRATLTTLLLVLALAPRLSAQDARLDYRLLATNATQTLERELNEAAFDGYRFAGMHAGDTAFGSRELVAGVERALDERPWHRFDYLVLATNRSGTLQQELDRASRAGFRLVGQTVFQTEFGGPEVIAVMERDINGSELWDYELLATTRTSTMERELRDAGRQGFALRGLSVGITAFGGPEVVAILERPARSAVRE